ncbi:hypothetical protein ACFPER_00905 [Agromyces aurantiacus]|uniref:DUF4386 family protein n=1 Tax=Agromyces aurantiacus TaxID=165814 RepID=A0ABV9R4U0_9MICO|nr:hypothetical protein [Agromyces aurantiacus]MBM7505643.1 hypothetical protein [Agromyces aurantiacus]
MTTTGPTTAPRADADHGIRTDDEAPAARIPSTTMARWTATAFAAAGVLWMLFPLLRPWADKALPVPPDLAAAWASDAWVVAHLCGIAALGLLAPALLGLRSVLAARPGGRGSAPAGWATGFAWVGAAGASLYYGAEIFGIRTVAEAALRRGDASLLDEVLVLREQPVAVVLFGVGLLLVGAAGVLAAVALLRARVPWAWAGLVFAAGLALVLPQFFGGPELRIAHGILFGLGCLVVAVAVGRLGTRAR